jgi:hypothetical protein
MAELGAFFGNPNVQRQGARARALAGQRDVNTLADPLTYAVMQGLLGTRPDEMGFSVLNPDYEKIKKVAEPAFALGLLGQAAPALAPLTKGLPVGASIKNVGKDLSAIQIGDRTIPVTINRFDKKSGGELVNVNPSTFDEAFSKTGWQYVGEKGKEGISGRYEKFENYLKDAKSIEASNVSVNKDGGIVFGDGRHRYAVLRDMGLDELPIVMDKESIKNAKKFGYLTDSPKNPIAPRQEALDTAQRNAALPVEEGGLGLPKDNTPEMRAEAMGGIDAVHFSRRGGDYAELDSGKFAIAPFDAVGTHVGTPQAAMERFQNTVGYKVNNPNYALDELTGSSYLVKVLGDKPLLNQNGMPWGEDDLNTFLRKTGGHNYSDINGGKLTYQDLNADLRKKLFDEQGYTSIPYFNEVEGKGSVSYIVPPKNLRSQFAAFDPKRRDETDILAGLLPLGVLADEEKRKEITSLLE